MPTKKIVLSIIFIAIILIGARITFLKISKTTSYPYFFSTHQFNKSKFDVVKVLSENTQLINFYYQNKDNEKIGSISKLKTLLHSNGEKLLFATNGGIFSKEFTPLGLYIENGTEIEKINLNNGDGNFYLKPNGVFVINKTNGDIIETSRYKENSDTLFAIQSGPLLVLNNKINDSFRSDSQNKYIRSGVGIDQDRNIYFVISETPVTFYEFASFFKEKLHCESALYLDGAISEMYIPDIKEEVRENFSVMIGITDNKN